MPKISAIVSAYYAEQYIQGRLENLVTQDVDLEIIVVCQEGSREQEIAKGFDSNVKVHIITTPDIPTVYQAWNLGINYSSGQYITNANSDDRHYPGALKELAEALDQHPSYSVSYSNVDRVMEINGAVEGKFEFLEGGAEELYWKGCFLGPMPMWRKTLHGRYGAFDGSFTIAGDLEFWLRIAVAKERFFHISKPLGAHLERQDSLEHRGAVKKIWETARARGKYRAIIEKEAKHETNNHAQNGKRPHR